MMTSPPGRHTKARYQWRTDCGMCSSLHLLRRCNQLVCHPSTGYNWLRGETSLKIRERPKSEIHACASRLPKFRLIMDSRAAVQGRPRMRTDLMSPCTIHARADTPARSHWETYTTMSNFHIKYMGAHHFIRLLWDCIENLPHFRFK